jgi:hypothetical protein
MYLAGQPSSNGLPCDTEKKKRRKNRTVAYCIDSEWKEKEREKEKTTRRKERFLFLNKKKRESGQRERVVRETQKRERGAARRVR